MLPLLTFATGLVAGIAGVRFLKSVKIAPGATPSADDIGKKAREGFDRARSGLRDAAVSGLAVVERASADLREKIAPDPASEPSMATAKASVEPSPAVKPKARRAPRKAAQKAPGGDS